MWRPKIIQKEFERNYIERSNIKRELYNEYYITLPCVCDYEDCEGWAAIRKAPDIVFDHCKFHFPPMNEYLSWQLREAK